MNHDLVPSDVRRLYEVHEWRHACAILAQDFPAEWQDLIEVLRGFRLLRSYIEVPGGNKSRVAGAIDSAFYQRGWAERSFQTEIVVDKQVNPSPTHSIDCFRNHVGIEVEWNNKDPFLRP